MLSAAQTFKGLPICLPKKYANTTCQAKSAALIGLQLAQPQVATTYKTSRNISVKGKFSLGTELAPSEPEAPFKYATFAGGCFWGIELAYQRVEGVIKTAVGYTQGNIPRPTYEAVCSGNTGHTEAILVTYDPTVVSFDQLCDVFFERVDVTTLNKQGGDVGTQYRSGIYYHDDVQKEIAQKRLAEADKALGNDPLDPKGPIQQMFQKRVVAECKPASNFYLAEDYHQQYLSRGGRFGQGQSAEKGCKDPIRCYG